MTEKNTYLEQYQGGFYGILRWPQLDELWDLLRAEERAWYVYQIGIELPESAASKNQLSEFIDAIDKLIRADHQESYCGIVYVDDKTQPSFIKIYDPNNLGSSCGSSGAPPPLPGWTVSIARPVDLQAAFPLPENRKRWWKKLFA